MKTKTTETVETVKITCDHCGGEVKFSATYCIVCGKYACDLCFIDKIRCLKIQGPRFFGLSQYEPELPQCYACKDCQNEITQAYDQLYAIVHGWRQVAEKCRKEYNPLAEKLAKMVEKREREIEQ